MTFRELVRHDTVGINFNLSFLSFIKHSALSSQAKTVRYFLARKENPITDTIKTGLFLITVRIRQSAEGRTVALAVKLRKIGVVFVECDMVERLYF